MPGPVDGTGAEPWSAAFPNSILELQNRQGKRKSSEICVTTNLFISGGAYGPTLYEIIGRAPKLTLTRQTCHAVARNLTLVGCAADWIRQTKYRRRLEEALLAAAWSRET